MEKDLARENRAAELRGRSLLIPRFPGTEWGCTRWRLRASRFPVDFEIETSSIPGVLQRDPESSKHWTVSLW